MAGQPVAGAGWVGSFNPPIKFNPLYPSIFGGLVAGRGGRIGPFYHPYMYAI